MPAAMMEPVVATFPAPHQPVMVDRIVGLLTGAGPEEGVLVDATIGAGGHAAALLAATPPGVVLAGFDRDPEALALAAERLAPFGERVRLVHARFDALAEHVVGVMAAHGPLVGVLYDLGVSSMQLDRAERGFSFRADGPLDMRMDPTRDASAADLVNTLDAAELARILRLYGEERYARRIAAAIVAARPLERTGALADVVRAAVPAAARYRAQSGTDPATRTFQALRIAVNSELDTFRASLPQALELAPPAADTGSSPTLPDRSPGPERRGAGSPQPRGAGRGGRVAVLSYHSLEDRIAKRVFAEAARGCICPPDLPVCGCGRSPLVRLLIHGAETPDPGEVKRNPRARSARLRAVEALPVA